MEEASNDIVVKFVNYTKADGKLSCSQCGLSRPKNPFLCCVTIARILIRYNSISYFHSSWTNTFPTLPRLQFRGSFFRSWSASFPSSLLPILSNCLCKRFCNHVFRLSSFWSFPNLILYKLQKKIYLPRKSGATYFSLNPPPKFQSSWEHPVSGF